MAFHRNMHVSIISIGYFGKNYQKPLLAQKVLENSHRTTHSPLPFSILISTMANVLNRPRLIN